MRLFVALYPPPAALDHLDLRLGDLHIGTAAARGLNARLPARETLHVTLAFLGEVDEDRLPDVEAALDRAAAHWRAARYSGARETSAGDAVPGLATVSSVRLGGGGRFGRGRFTVMWVGLTGDVPAVRQLSAAIRRQLRRGRLPYDRRPFRPHLTVARPGDRLDRDALNADRDALDRYLGPPWPVTEMVLVRSHLGPRPTYHRLAGWPL